MAVDILAELAKTGGVAGVVLGLCLLAIRRLHQDLQELRKAYDAKLSEVQEKRVKDGQAMVDKLLDLNNKWNDTLSAQGEANEEGAKILTEMRSQVSNMHMLVTDLYNEAKR